MRYTAWGEVRYTWGSTPTDYTYTGQYSNVPEFGLMFYQARWYDPYITHFSQPDSIVPDPYNSQDWNRYAYARGNPIKYTDPSGHMVECEDGDEGGGCGRGANTAEIYKTFDKAHGGQYDGLFAEYYALLHEANLAIYKGDPDAEAVVGTAYAAKERALAYVPQQDFDPVMLIDPDTLLKFSQMVVSLGKETGGLAAGIIIYRGGGTNPGNLTPRSIDNGKLSFRDSLSNPWPLPKGQRPNFLPGEPYFGVDTSMLPGGSVDFDNTPPGHVSVSDVSPDILKDAVVVKGTFPK